MNVYQSQCLILSMVFSFAYVAFSVLTITARRTWFVTVMTLNTLVFGVVFGIIAVVRLSDERAQVIASLVPELPFILILSWVCLAPAGYLPARFGTGILEPVARRSWLRSTLKSAPVVLGASWISAAAVGLIWPSPALRFYASAPSEYVVMKWLLMSTEAFYCALVGWVFLAAAIRAPVWRLRMKNLAFSVGVVCWLLMAVNASANAGVRAWAPAMVRRGIVEVQLLLEANLAVISMGAFAVGLTLRYVPGIAEAILPRLHEGLLFSQTRFESLKWRLVTSGKVRGVIRASQYATDAAEREGLTDLEVEKILTTIQLIAIFRDASPETDELSPKNARELYKLQKEVMNDEQIGSKLHWTREWRAEHSADRIQDMRSSPLPDALEAALDLAEHCPFGEGVLAEEPRRPGWPLWYYFAAVSAGEAALLDRNLVAEKAAEAGDQAALLKAQRAHEVARNAARSLTLSKE